ncbi:hypothetical protein [Candidatus Leptofilum sp.]|uniref:hypothetical protein n=1 Tax=Candidatus Leptofilum sp. TaxID=3241576 RepID=UPI003B5A22E6
MNTTPPNGSKISTQFTDGYQTIIVPHKKVGAFRYFIGAFLIFWLGGWALALVTTVTQLLRSPEPFLLIWLGGWTLGGAFAFYMVYRLFRKPIPEALHLNLPNLTFDTGVPPLDLKFGTRYSMEYWKSMFHRRKKIEFMPIELKSLRLRETDSGNRLTIDRGADRIDIATRATEVEREWLYSTLKDVSKGRK